MFRKILVPLDQSNFAEEALGPAISIARAAHAEIELVMVHEPRPLAGSPDVAWHAEQADGERRYLAAIAADVTKTHSVITTFTLLRGEVVGAICDHSRSASSDLIVMTSHGLTGMSRSWIGSVSDGVLRRSGVAVLMCRPHEKSVKGLAFRPFKRIVVPLDGSSLATGVLRSAVSLAISCGARLSLLRVVQPVQLLTMETAIPFAFPLPVRDDISTMRAADRIRRELSEFAWNLADQNIVNVDSHVAVAHDIEQAIVDFALQLGADAIAMSTHGRGASRLLIGSVADKVIRLAQLPMLLKGPSERTDELRMSRDSVSKYAGAF